MNISNNIIKESLKNVYFLCGGAYGGKTTMAKLLEEKHGFLRYRQGDHSEEYAAIAIEECQPTLSFDRGKDWYGYFSQDIKDFHNYFLECLKEESEFAIVDLLKLCGKTDRKIIFDGMIPINILKQISDHKHVILLFAPVEMKRKYYFNREDKDEIYQFIMTLPNAEFLLENTRNALAYKGVEEIQSYYDSGFLCIERSEDNTIKKTLEVIEKHLCLV